ncbi:MAG: hypothetical protein ACR2PG_10045 [Hyphomicrobiaceae bacterium]
MELWIPITIFAAFLQNLRSSLQKYLKGRLTTLGATFSRFAFAAPLACLYVAGLAGLAGLSLPSPTAAFAVYGLVGAVAQILGTATLVYIFSFRNFAVGTTLSKTETVQTALFGFIVLDETISRTGSLAILLSLVGVMMISVSRSSMTARDLMSSLLDRTALIGVASGAFFGISAVAYRAASLSLDGGDFIMRAAFTLAFVTIFQTVVMSAYMRITEPGQIRKVLSCWKVSGWVGFVGWLGSVCWITAMTLQNAAYVRALGQIELLFTLAVSYFFFRERSSMWELSGITLVTVGILALVLWN